MERSWGMESGKTCVSIQSLLLSKLVLAPSQEIQAEVKNPGKFNVADSLHFVSIGRIFFLMAKMNVPMR